MKYYLGIDGGGTKTKVCLIDENDQIIGISEAGASSIDTVTMDTTYQNILEPLIVITKNMSKTFVIESVFAGIGGIVSEADERIVEEIILKLPYLSKKTLIKAKNDMYNALYSGLLFEEGMCLIVGTGSVAFGKNKNNHFHKCGGWGYKEGDAGSAYDLGHQAIRLAVRAIDGRIPVSNFTQEIREHLNLNTVEDIVPVINHLWDERTKIADYAKIVTKHANLNDSYALNIVNKSVDELVLAVEGVYKRIKPENKTLVIVGSLGNASGYFQDQLHKKIKLIDREIKIISPIVDPALGAALMSKTLKS